MVISFRLKDLLSREGLFVLYKAQLRKQSVYMFYRLYTVVFEMLYFPYAE
jgi:hypothetical protein